jgi:hypothetical protein
MISLPIVLRPFFRFDRDALILIRNGRESNSKGETPILSLQTPIEIRCHHQISQAPSNNQARYPDMGEPRTFTRDVCCALALPFLASISIDASNVLHVTTGESFWEAKKDAPSQKILPSG